MTSIYLLGAMFGFGLILIATSFSPHPAPLGRALRRLHTTPVISEKTSSWTTQKLGESWKESTLGQWSLKGTRTDLAVCGIDPAEFLAQRIGVASIAVLWAPITTALMAAGGVAAPVTLSAWMSLALAPVGFLYPSFRLKTQAAERRRSFRHAFGAFLDIVSVSLAGGKGVDSALTDGANAGNGWTFDRLREALLSARLRGKTPWSGLSDLGMEFNLPELQELAASAALAGSEGARVRMSVAAKAKTLRLKGLADVESAAQSASERMSIPVVALMMGFVFFLAYPAIIAVTEGF